MPMHWTMTTRATHPVLHVPFQYSLAPFLVLHVPIQHSLAPLLGRRGPDAAGADCLGVGGGMTMHLEGSVLHMQGPLTAQPLVSSNGDALLWNGEVFAGIKVHRLSKLCRQGIHSSL